MKRLRGLMLCIICIYAVLPADVAISPAGTCDSPLLLTLDVCHASTPAVTADNDALFVNECTCGLTREDTPNTQPLAPFIFRPFIIASMTDHPPESSPILS